MQQTTPTIGHDPTYDGYEHLIKEASLDPLESPEHETTVSTSDEERPAFALPGHTPLSAALELAGTPVKRLLDIRLCGSQFKAFKHRTAQPAIYRIARTHCRHRFCPRCQRHRAQLIQRNMSALAKTPNLRLITLTIRSNSMPLGAQINSLYDSFKRLRKTQTWKRTQIGGIAFFELTRSASSGLWHPHLHLIAEGTFIAQQTLSTAWHTASRGSPIVDIRLIRNPQTALRYVTKYVSLPIPTALWYNHEQARELIHALKNRKLIFGFGTWIRHKLLTEPESGDWQPIYDEPHAIELADRSPPDSLAKVILAAWHRIKHTPQEAIIIDRHGNETDLDGS